MKRTIFIAVLWLVCAGLQARGYVVPADSVRSLCAFMVQRYPKATLQDLYKTCYQDFFGPGHMVTDSAAARNYLHRELEDLTGEGADEPTGFRHRFVRIDLRRVAKGEISEEEVMNRFMEAANTATPVHDNWAGEWAQIEAIALQEHPGWADAEMQAALRKAAQNNRAVHHSDAYRQAYQPRYRLAKTKQ